MRGVRIVAVGFTDHTMAIPGDSLVRVHEHVTHWHVGGELHRLQVQGDVVVDTLVPKGTHAYRAGMALFSDEGD